MMGRANAGAGGLRIKSARGRGGVVDGVIFERVRGRRTVLGIQARQSPDPPRISCESTRIA